MILLGQVLDLFRQVYKIKSQVALLHRNAFWKKLTFAYLIAEFANRTFWLSITPALSDKVKNCSSFPHT